MKKIILPIIVLSLLFGGVAFAQETELPDPGLTPDSPFYFLERITEAIGTFFTFGDLKKAKRYTALAAERLAEAQAVAEKEKPELIEKILERYENQLVKALFRAERAQTKGKDTEEITKTITEASQKHIIVLERVLEKVPEQAKPAIERAITVSTKEGLEKAVVEFKQKKVSSDIDYELLKAKCLESGAPADMCESVDKALQSSFSPKELCEKSGGPPEMCERIPTRGFRSFKQIESLCEESGGPADICGTLEDKCRELGITKPDDCFRVLSISSVTVYAATGPTAVPLPERDSDCPRGYITYGTTKYCCEDSDRSSPLSQRHYYMKGTTESRIINTADGTLTSHEINTDSCDGDRLTEWMCDNRLETTFEKFNCPKGCENGACKGLHEIMEMEQGGMIKSREISSETDLGGIGIQIGIKNGQLTIMGFTGGSSAEKAGLQIGDKILAISGENIAGIAIDDAVTRISGKIGTNVVLKISRLTDDRGISLAISVTRTYIAP